MTSELRRLIGIVEETMAPGGDLIQQWAEEIAASATTDLGRAWVLHQAPGYAEGWASNPEKFVLSDRAKRLADYMRIGIALVDRYRPNDLDLDVPDLLQRYALPEYVLSLLPLTRLPAVADWIRAAIPAHIERIGISTFFVPDSGDIGNTDWRAIHRKVIEFLNTTPPGRADTRVEDVIAMMRDPEAHRPATRLRSRHLGGASFKAWFGDSRVVDKLGHPLVVFRGTQRPGDPSGTAYDTKLNTISFTSSPDIASVYASKAGFFGAPEYGKGSTVSAYYLSIQNPLVFDDTTTTMADAIDKLLPGAYPVDDASFDRLTSMVRELQEWQEEDGRAFKVELPRRGYFELDWDDLIERLERLQAKGKGEAINDLLADMEIDSYAIADSGHYVAWAMEKGFDGIIHTDVFGATGERAAISLMGKSADDMKGLNHDGETATHLTYRPFRQNQIKAVFNRGTFNPESDHVAEQRR